MQTKEIYLQACQSTLGEWQIPLLIELEMLNMIFATFQCPQICPRWNYLQIGNKWSKDERDVIELCDSPDMFGSIKSDCSDYSWFWLIWHYQMSLYNHDSWFHHYMGSWSWSWQHQHMWHLCMLLLARILITQTLYFADILHNTHNWCI